MMNKVVLVTGSASGIGKGIAEHYFNNGFNLLLVDIDGHRLKANIESMYKGSIHGQKVEYLAGDLKDHSFRKEIIRFANKEFNNINILVNCAGIFPSTPALEVSEKEWDDVFNLNVKSLFFLSRDVARLMKESDVEGCNIVNITSAASEVARPGVAHYCSSKAAVKMLTQVLSLEFAAYGIRVNAIGPGLVETETLLKSLDNQRARNEHKEKISYAPLNRTAKISEIAETVMFITSDKASYITGQNILVDGGYSAGRVFKSFT